MVVFRVGSCRALFCAAQGPVQAVQVGKEPVEACAASQVFEMGTQLERV